MTLAPMFLESDPIAWSALRLNGEDSLNFLQGQLTNDVVAGQKRGLLLTPTSDVVSDVYVQNEGTSFILTLRTELVEEAEKRLRRFLLRSRVSIERHDGVTGPYATVGEQIAGEHPGPRELAVALPPQSYGARFVRDRVSFTKGCFTGQELVGRLDARSSSVPFRLAVITGPSLETIDAAVRGVGPQGDAARQGVTTAVTNAQGVVALALIHRSMVETVLPEGMTLRVANAEGEA